MASKLLHLLHVMAILESCRGGHGGKIVKTEEVVSETVVTLLRARGASSDVLSDVPPPPGPPGQGGPPGVSSDVPPPHGGPAGVSSSSPERRLLSARQSAHHHRDMLSINMFKVYERYSKEPHISQKDGNTVRSFKAAPHGTSEGRERFRFNLSSIQESEHILSASFHFLYKRPRPHQHHPHPPRLWPCRRAHNPSCSGEHDEPPASRPPQLLLRGGGGGGASPSGAFAEPPLGLNVTLSPPKRGSWQVIDVTALVRRARDAEEPMFAAEFDFGSLARSQQPQQKQQQVNKAHHGGHHTERPSSSASLPYVLVYADDRVIDEPNSVAASLQRYGPFPVGNEEERVRLAANANAPASASASRARRDLLLRPPPLSAADQIQTNDLPEVHFSSLKNHELWQSTYFPPMKAKVAVKHGRSKAGQENGGGLGKAGQENGGGGLGKPPRVLSFDERTMKKARRRQWSEPRVCARRYLRVDFADIGWSEWVLAPKAFDAYYCAGTCGFPIPKVVRPSNHATIQSIVRAVGIVPGVPEPCCVPDKMSPLSVLFLDPERNMVLKVYPGMSVDTCACR